MFCFLNERTPNTVFFHKTRADPPPGRLSPQRSLSTPQHPPGLRTHRTGGFFPIFPLFGPAPRQPAGVTAEPANARLSPRRSRPSHLPFPALAVPTDAAGAWRSRAGEAGTQEVSGDEPPCQHLQGGTVVCPVPPPPAAAARLSPPSLLTDRTSTLPRERGHRWGRGRGGRLGFHCQERVGRRWEGERSLGSGGKCHRTQDFLQTAPMQKGQRSTAASL